MEIKSSKKIEKISNVEKNFIHVCQICFEDYDTAKHIPMIICSNYHAVCAQCVKSNLFKKEYNAAKYPTGRFMCSKCSEIIQKQQIRQHRILKEVCTYIQMIQKKEEELRKQFYHHIGSMGMNLVAMRSDFDTIEKNNMILKKENEFLIKQNCKLREEFIKIQKIKGSYEQLQKLAKQVEQSKEILQLQNAKLQSITDQIKRKNQEVLSKRDLILQKNKEFYQLQAQITSLKQQIRMANIKSKQLLEHNQGAINLKQYLQQEINSLQNEKKNIIEQNNNKKRKINDSLKLIQKYWENTLKNESNSDYLLFNIPNQNVNKIEQKQIQQFPQEKQKEKVQSLDPQKKNENIAQIQGKNDKQMTLNIFDLSEKSVKNFLIDGWNVTLINKNLSQFTHISFEDQFNLLQDRQFLVKVKGLQSSQIMIGMMTSQCKYKRNIYDRKGFYAIDGFGKVWIDGICNEGNFKISQGNEIKVKFSKNLNSLIFSKKGSKNEQSIRLPQKAKIKALYPVFLLISEGDSFEILGIY